MYLYIYLISNSLYLSIYLQADREVVEGWTGCCPELKDPGNNHKIKQKHKRSSYFSRLRNLIFCLNILK